MSSPHRILLALLVAAGGALLAWLALGQGAVATGGAGGSGAATSRLPPPAAPLAEPPDERAAERSPLLPDAREPAESAPGTSGEDASALERFARTFHTRLSAEALGTLAFAEDPSSEMRRVRIVVRGAGLTAEELRALHASLPAGDPLRAWTVLGVAYGADLGRDHLAWLEELATRSADHAAPEDLAAIHAVRAASGYDALDAAGAARRVAGTLLERAAREAEPGSSEALEVALPLALGPVDELGEALPLDWLERLTRGEGRSEALAAACYEALARAGGPAGARAVASAVARGDPAALGAVAAIRDPSATDDLVAWIESGARDGGDPELASAALSGLFATGDPLALDALASLLRSDGRLAPEVVASRRRIAVEGLAALREERSRGLVRRAQHLLESWIDSPEREPRLASAAAETREALDPARTAVRAWVPPPDATRRAVCESLRRALDALPPGSDAHSAALYDLARIARPEDLGYVENHLVEGTPFTAGIREAFARARDE